MPLWGVAMEVVSCAGAAGWAAAGLVAIAAVGCWRCCSASPLLLHPASASVVRIGRRMRMSRRLLVKGAGAYPTALHRTSRKLRGPAIGQAGIERCLGCGLLGLFLGAPGAAAQRDALELHLDLEGAGVLRARRIQHLVHRRRAVGALQLLLEPGL